MDARGIVKLAKTGAAVLSVGLLSACATPGGSMSTKGVIAFETPEDLCSIEPSRDMIRTLRQRPDYADIIVALGQACPDRADLFGIGATASVPSLTMVEEDGSPGMFANWAPPAEIGRDVAPPAPPVDDGTPVVVTDPPPEVPAPAPVDPAPADA